MPDVALESTALPRAAPQPVLGLGAFLRNRACLLQAGTARWSPLHGDLGSAPSCEALAASARALLAIADAQGTPPVAIAHDLHPDFFSTRLAIELAAERGVPAVAVQHHHAHIAVVLAESGADDPVIGIALDGVGLGEDGTAWGGEILRVKCRPAATTPMAAPGLATSERLAHLAPLALPGGDRAAREPWRLAAAVLHRLGRGHEIEPRYGAVAGPDAARTVRALLERGALCPPTTAAGRWFDAAAAALEVHAGPQAEAEAPKALQAQAQRWLDSGAALPEPEVASLDLLPVVAALFDVPLSQRPRAAALFHAALAAGVAGAAARQARTAAVGTVVLGGGCFANRILRDAVVARLSAAGLRAASPQHLDWGDGSLALGQAWVASWASLP